MMPLAGRYMPGWGIVVVWIDGESGSTKLDRPEWPAQAGNPHAL